MFRKIRKIKNEIGKDAVDSLLHSCRRGVLSMNGDDGYPYSIPINYYYDEANQKIYFHGAKAGYKVDCLNRNDKVCFTVFGNENNEELSWAPYVQSVVVFGRCHLIDTDNEILKTFAMKYYPSSDLADMEIKEGSKFVQMYEISIEHKSVKQVQEK